MVGGPCVGVVSLVCPLRCAPVFGVEAHEVDTYLQRRVALQGASQLEHHSHATRSVVGSHHRTAPVGRIGVVVSPRTTVPMGAEQYACGLFGAEARYDVARAQHRAVPSLQLGVLSLNAHAELAELLHYPLAAAVVSRRVHDARTKLALLCGEHVRRVGAERRTYERHGVGFGGCLRCVLARCARTCYRHYCNQ